MGEGLEYCVLDLHGLVLRTEKSRDARCSWLKGLGGREWLHLFLTYPVTQEQGMHLELRCTAQSGLGPWREQGPADIAQCPGLISCPGAVRLKAHHEQQVEREL